MKRRQFLATLAALASTSILPAIAEPKNIGIGYKSLTQTTTGNYSYPLGDCVEYTRLGRYVNGKWYDGEVKVWERSACTTEAATQNSVVGEQHEAQGSGQ
jgi:hypothetical protein